MRLRSLQANHFVVSVKPRHHELRLWPEYAQASLYKEKLDQASDLELRVAEASTKPRRKENREVFFANKRWLTRLAPCSVVPDLLKCLIDFFESFLTEVCDTQKRLRTSLKKLPNGEDTFLFQAVRCPNL
jgi:hypothetical protein